MVGTISSDEIALVKHSFALLGEQKVQLTLCFYARLFELEPDLRVLFQGNPSEPALQFLAMLTALVNGLSQLEMLRQTATASIGVGLNRMRSIYN